MGTAATKVKEFETKISRKPLKVGKKQQNQNFEKSAKNPILVLLYEAYVKINQKSKTFQIDKVKLVWPQF